MINKEEIINITQSTIDMLYMISDWEESAMLKAMDLDMHAEKLKNRYEGTSDGSIRKYLECEIKDLFPDITLVPKLLTKHADLSHVRDPESFFVEYNRVLWEMLERLGFTANKYIEPFYMYEWAHHLKYRCECIKKEIVKTNRRISRGRKCGWTHDLMIYE